MREYSVPPGTAEPALSPPCIGDYVFANAETMHDHPVIRRRSPGRHRSDEGWTEVSAAQLAAAVLAVARGLIGSGIVAGDRVAVMSRTRYEWTVVDFAVMSVGAVTVPVYETSSAEQIEWILSDSRAKICFVESAAHRATVASVQRQLPALEQVWTFDERGLDEVGRVGVAVDDAEVHRRRAAVTPADLASIIYTSGTTGRPKGCRLTHGNFAAEISQVVIGLRELFNPDSSTLLFIPIAHVFGRMIQVGAIATGTTLGHTADVAKLVEDLESFQPVFILSVPRVFEKVFNTAAQTAYAEGKSRIFDRSADVAVAYSQALDRRGASPWLRLQHEVFDRLVYRKIRARLGGQCRAAISGGAPLGDRLAHFFRGMGVTIFEGYGLTESTAGACVNLQDALKMGTVGRPIPGMSLRIADDGELLMRGNVVFDGYWNNAEATAEAFDPDGWFLTGDLGEIDDDGYVRITGRKKEIIVTANGKNVAPALLEDRLRAHWLVAQCLVVGDGRPFVGALITLDRETLPLWLKRNGYSEQTPISDVVDNDALRAEVQLAVDDANKAVSRAESIRKFTILAEDWTEAGGQITASSKLKRAIVSRESAADIDALYAAPQI